MSETIAAQYVCTCGARGDVTVVEYVENNTFLTGEGEVSVPGLRRYETTDGEVCNRISDHEFVVFDGLNKLYARVTYKIVDAEAQAVFEDDGEEV